MNIGWACILYGSEWFDRWHDLTAFADGIEHYTTVTKWVSDQIKTRSYYAEDRFNYVECANLVGYRNLPYPGFDLQAEAKAYAEGDDIDFHFPTGDTFDSIAQDMLMTVPTYVPWISFEDYVAGASWLTAGASSQGHLRFKTPDGKIHKLKCRKNFVLDVLTVQELLALCKAKTGQTNYTLIKSELGKVRLAVASDLETYLMMSWMLYFVNGAYKDWPGNTLEESPSEQSDRMCKMMELCQVMYGLPFDFKGFEHQPKTPQIVTINRILNDIGRHNVPIEHRFEYDSMASRIERSYYFSELICRDVKTRKETRYKVKNGLMSGIRLTSTIGNGWNTVMTEAARRRLANAGLETQTIEKFIRGDDSAIFTDRAALARLFELAYTQLGVKGGVGKFSVRKHEMEFLRIWYSNRCYGYPSRAIPGLTQRKPWSSTPWSEDGVLSALKEVCCILNRRGLNSDKIWRVLKARWCSLHRLPLAVTMVPRSAGGLGLDPWDGRTTISNPLPNSLGLDATFDILPWRANKLAEVCKKYNIPLSRDQLDESAQTALQGVLAADDVPDISTMLRRNFRDQLTELKIKPIPSLVKSQVLSPIEFTPPLAERGSFAKMHQQLDRQVGNFGLFRRDVEELKSIKPLLSKAKISISSWLKANRPQLYFLTRKGHIGEALDWLGGYTSTPLSKIHPMMHSAVTKICAIRCKFVKWRDRVTDFVFAKIAPGSEEMLYNSPLNQKIFQW